MFRTEKKNLLIERNKFGFSAFSENRHENVQISTDNGTNERFDQLYFVHFFSLSTNFDLFSIDL